MANTTTTRAAPGPAQAPTPSDVDPRDMVIAGLEARIRDLSLGVINVFIKKTGETVRIDTDSLPRVSRLYLKAYGLKQKLNDGHSAYTAEAYPDPAVRARAVMAMVNKQADKLRAGDVPGTTSPVVALAANVATAIGTDPEKMAKFQAFLDSLNKPEAA